MHIPDGFIDAGTSVGAGVVSAGGLGVAVRRSARVLQDKQVPLAGLVAAFVFAGQMLNFPVAAGTSGHLIGGALAAILVGPWTGAICISVVLLTQAVFADGGLTALGLNILNMALVGCLGGWALFKLVRSVAPRTRSGVIAAAAIAGGCSVVLAAAAFLIEYARGGTASVPVGTVAWAMLGVHGLIGIGEAVITAVTVGSVLAVRPDLVYGASDLAAPLELRTRETVVQGSA
jgi:cobalamin biosynthesis protein CbiM